MPTRNGNGRYSEPQKLAIIADALIYGEREAARRHNVAHVTIGNWLKPLGGYAAVHQHLATVRETAIGVMERATAMAYEKRASQFSNEHLLQAFTEMLQARKSAGTTIVNAPIAQAGVSVSDDGIGRALIAAERAFLAECQRPALGEAERPALESE